VSRYQPYAFFYCIFLICFHSLNSLNSVSPFYYSHFSFYGARWTLADDGGVIG
jgi:hypothetical protein